MTEPLTAAEELRRSIRCLALEVPESVWDDVNAKVETVLSELEFVGEINKALTPYQERAVKAEAEVDRLREALGRIYRQGRGKHVEIAREALNG